MPFLNPLSSDFIPGTNNIILTGELKYWCPRTHQLFVVPEGFPSDCASIPKVLWPLLGHPFDHKWRKEAVLHDWFYRSEYKIIPRKTADQVFYDGLRAQGLGYIKGQAMYLGVRIGGAASWRSNL